MKKEFISTSERETEEIASNFSKRTEKGNVIALFGDMGVGKTAFVRGFARGLNLDCDVSSPTFALINEYYGIREGGCFNLYHYDMYRIESVGDLYSANFFEYLDDLSRLGVMIIEWSEKIIDYLPENSVNIKLEKISDNERKICVESGVKN